MYLTSVRAGTGHIAPRRKRLWSNSTVHAAGALVVAVLIPFLIRLGLAEPGEGLVQLYQSAIGSCAAILAGAWLLRSVNNFPGAEASAYIIPSFSVAFGALVMVLTIGRIEYARVLLVAGYGLSVVWYFAVHVAMQRLHVQRIGYLPFGAVGRLPDVPQIQWIPILSADAPLPPVDSVAVDLRFDLPDDWDRRISDIALAGIPVFHIKQVLESLTGRVELEHLSENSFGSLAPLSSFMSIKRIVDWVSALLAGIFLLPFLLGVALAIRATSPGPALFRQTRVGYRGRPFTVYKFRTMRVAAEPGCREAAKTQVNDSRISPFGRFLRTTRIDELPQIINILRGEMSWIGPRPEAEVLSRWYEAEIPFYRYRHVVRPGIAGWAQVTQGHVAELDEVQSKLHYDFFYIKHFSPWIDLLIIAKTIRTVFSGHGSK